MYEALPQHKSDLTEGGLAEYMTSDQTEELRSATLKTLLRLASPDRKELVEKMIKLVFPPIVRIKGHDTEEWLKSRKVCHSQIFDRYFSYRLSETDVSQNDLDAFIKAADDREFVSKFLEEHTALGLLRATLERLLLRVEEIDGSKALFCVLCLPVP